MESDSSEWNHNIMIEAKLTTKYNEGANKSKRVFLIPFFLEMLSLEILN